ncbi:glycosyltransferase [Flavobacterium procerum]|uniref:Glycosyltransferase n=1 Tax=Flavobacterium procerum TaxID=1455569 RepID=A0ABV6BL48_9FLAO
MIHNLKDTDINLHSQAITLDDQGQYYDMIVFSNLRYQFVYQRPQHIMSRMAESMKILFIEEPCYNAENENSGNLMIINERLHVLQPNTRDIKSIAEIIPTYVKNKNIVSGWFYSPTFCPLIELFNFDTIIYDCLEDLSLSKDVTAELIEQEKYLTSRSDIIFTNSKTLYETKNQVHDNVHFFPNSVDEEHFAKALNNISIPADIGDLQSPIVGYYGVIDSRIDFKLLEETAKNLPNVSFVMIGPLSEITQKDLPNTPNIHYLGMKCYNELPYYLKAFDIAMIPFLLDDAVKYNNPTKTLEYMAAKKPIISTKIIEIMRDYSHCVNLIDNTDDFTNAIAFLCDDTERPDMEAAYAKILKNTSWDTTAEKMKTIVKFYAK